MSDGEVAEVLDIGRIMEIMPHRYPFLMVDRILEYEIGEWIRGVKNVTFNEPFFIGHFPRRPVMPGVLIVEAMAQCGGIMAHLDPETGVKDGGLIFISGFDNTKFRHPVVPGDQLILELEQRRRGKRILKMAGKAMVDGVVVASTELSAVVIDVDEGNNED